MAVFNPDEISRYSRQFMLEDVGYEGQLKLRQAKVLVIGAGGLGCPALQYLNGAGIGTLGIVDHDKVEIHNLHRQILYSLEDVGKAKAPAAAAKLRAANPNVEHLVFDEKLTEVSAGAIISGFDIVLDGTDNFSTRYLVNDACVALEKPLVYGSILKYAGQLTVFNYQGGKNLRDLYPEPPNPEDVPNCSENGVMGYVPGILGTYMAAFAIQVILGSYESQELLLMDFKHPEIRKIRF